MALLTIAGDSGHWLNWCHNVIQFQDGFKVRWTTISNQFPSPFPHYPSTSKKLQDSPFNHISNTATVLDCLLTILQTNKQKSSQENILLLGIQIHLCQEASNNCLTIIKETIAAESKESEETRVKWNSNITKCLSLNIDEPSLDRKPTLRKVKKINELC